MAYERLKPSFVFDEERLNQLKQVAPEAFAAGKINWDVLKEALGEYVEDESQEAEHFGLFWPGKREARKLASIPSKGTLIPVKGEGIDEEKTQNIFIEGENLEVLKLLQKSYAGKIKMIYIDPPYNTGNDFIYDDNFTQPLEEYLKYTGQMDEEGRVLTTNTKADGRFHSKWLSMMYPRLRLARNLLREDGVIFISIDDNEVAHLKKICDEIFGEENIITTFIWRKKRGHGRGDTLVIPQTEYILNYAKNISSLTGYSQPLSEHKLKYYRFEDERGKYARETLEHHTPKGAYIRKTLQYNLEIDGKKIYCTTGQWLWKKERAIEEWRNGNIDLEQDKEGRWRAYKKIYLEVEGEIRSEVPISLIDDPSITNNSATIELKNVLGAAYYDFPKPSALIKKLLSFSCIDNADDIILDFFAGSGTTGHAVLDFNKEKKKSFKFICVQLPEICNPDSEAFKAGFKTLAEIGKERIRRVIKNIKKETRIDFGLKIFKLDKSNFKKWQDYQGKDLKELQQVFEHWQSPLIDGWKEEDLLIEIILQEGFPLDSKIEQLGQYSKNKILQVSSEFCEHKLLICLDKKVYQETINDLALGSDDRFICLDNALNDEQKVRLSDKGFLKTI